MEMRLILEHTLRTTYGVCNSLRLEVDKFISNIQTRDIPS